jgi:predicted lactoylglutathione lyase
VEFFKELGVSASETELDEQVQQARVVIGNLAQLNLTEERLSEFVERVTQLIDDMTNERGLLLPMQRMN